MKPASSIAAIAASSDSPTTDGTDTCLIPRETLMRTVSPSTSLRARARALSGHGAGLLLGVDLGDAHVEVGCGQSRHGVVARHAAHVGHGRLRLAARDEDDDGRLLVHSRALGRVLIEDPPDFDVLVRHACAPPARAPPRGSPSRRAPGACPPRRARRRGLRLRSGRRSGRRRSTPRSRRRPRASAASSQGQNGRRRTARS